MSDELTLADILSEREAPPSITCAHDAIAARLKPLLGSADTSQRFVSLVDDPRDFVADFVARGAGRSVGINATWLRIIDRWHGRGLLAVAHPGYVTSEADLIVVAEPGMMTRPVIQDLCVWAFRGLGFQRVVARLQPSEAHLADYLRRAGFLHEGTAFDFFGRGADASLWGMSVHRCRWLSSPPLAIPTADTSPPSSLVRH
ncbi:MULTISPECIES: hypothetical protein [Methylorubrum]|uniref:hypothetical protein n=1 Tax=Methylorubrum TaxID=2282523 RepID=UPI00209E11A4|nr:MULTISPECIES: hypothetical protein [Methylorubrum]MCP1551637.1 hypothetical protein [Methylorubrum zatmanii]MCP1556604.1 hypothetical protein [Methylorubrum extorquens]MCP1581972.1 hypothetical protein [Methylorubrum extorquens]